MSHHTITKNGKVVAIVNQDCCPTDTHITYLTPNGMEANNAIRKRNLRFKKGKTTKGKEKTEKEK